MKNSPVLMSKPIISIITVNYNDLEGLKRTFKSVFNQTWKEFEYIVIDGGSNDGSAEYILNQGSRIDYWVSESDSGIYNAMNKGIRASNGKYLLFLNSGDELINSEVLNKNHNHLKDKDVYYFNIQINELGKLKNKILPETLNFKFLYEDTIPHQSSFIKKDLFAKIGCYDEHLELVSDWKFFIIAFYKFNASFEFINQVLSVFYLGGASSDKNMIMEEREKVMKTDFSMILKDIKNYFELKKKLNKLRYSKKIRIMIKLGLLKKF